MKYEEFKDLNLRKDQQINNINHFFSRYFANICGYLFYLMRFTPNQTTLVFILVGVTGGMAALLGYYLIAYLLWRLHIIIDMADGSIARATKTFSDLGPKLDKVGHHLVYPLYWFGLLYSSGLLESYPIQSMIFFGTSMMQWTVKHLDNKNQRTSNVNRLYKRIIVNIMGIEGFLLIFCFHYFFNFDLIYSIYFFIASNLVFLFIKIKGFLLQ